MLLSAEHLSINFGSRQLLDDVNFYLNEGDKVGVIGINGTGKSTLLKIIIGAQPQTSGTMSFHGAPYEPKTPMDANKAGVGIQCRRYERIYWFKRLWTADEKCRDLSGGTGGYDGCHDTCCNR